MSNTKAAENLRQSMGNGCGKKANENIKRGFYAKTLTEAEKIEWDTIAVGELDEELKLARVQLRRVLEAQHRSAEELVRTKLVTTSAGTDELKAEATDELPNYQEHATKLLSTINRLEKTRAEIRNLVTAVHDEGVQGFRERLAQMEAEVDGTPLPFE